MFTTRLNGPFCRTALAREKFPPFRKGFAECEPERIPYFYARTLLDLDDTDPRRQQVALLVFTLAEKKVSSNQLAELVVDTFKGAETVEGRSAPPPDDRT
jgi:hypothetical protein